MPGFQSTRLVTEGALEPFFFLYTDDSIQGNPETCKQGSIMLNYEVKNNFPSNRRCLYYNWKFWPLNVSLADRHLSHRLAAKYGTGGRLGWQSAYTTDTEMNKAKFHFHTTNVSSRFIIK